MPLSSEKLLSGDADQRRTAGHRHCNVIGIRVQLAAVQHAPIAQACIPVQSVEQVFPLQRTRPLHDPLPRQVIVFIAPSA